MAVALRQLNPIHKKGTIKLYFNSVLNKGKSAIPPLFNGAEVLSSASGKAKLFTENFSKNS